MGTLKEDLQKQREWIIKALNSSNYKADGTIESLKEIDRFFDEEKKPGGLLDRPKIGYILFGISAYVGEVAIKEVGGEWITDDDDLKGEINIAIKLKNGAMIWPAHKVLNRYHNGEEDNLYYYMCDVCKKEIGKVMTGEEFIKMQKKKENRLTSLIKKIIGK